MAAGYKFVSWNRTKIIYDLALFAGVILYLSSYYLVSAGFDLSTEQTTAESAIVRGLGTCAFVMLTIVLSIGPLARLSPRFKPLLYNRRHFGVTTFTVAALHGLSVIFLYHGFADGNPLVAIFTEDADYASLNSFPYEALGVTALLVLFLMAITSHDFWLNTLSATFWKALHMLVYIAYALLVFHIVIGALQNYKPGIYLYFASASAIIVAGLHLLSGLKEYKADRGFHMTDKAEWIKVGKISAIPDERAIIVPVPNAERVAVFRDRDHIHAVSNVCPHQNGPLGEGRIVNGCIVCPWHGYEYDPVSGKSPPPFTEEVATYETRLEGDDIWLRLTPNSA